MDKNKILDVALEAVKQQITLSVGVMAFLAALADKNSQLFHRLPIVILFLCISFLCGIFVILAISYELYGVSDPFKSKLVRVFGITQAVTFSLGIFCLAGIIMFS